MGGTFDPIHHGHLVAASEVADRFELDEVVFVPTGQPWQKTAEEVSPAEDRYLMTVIATASNPRFSVSRVDIDRGGPPTYTADTLRDLRTLNPPDAQLFFITGADALEQILSWRKLDELFENAHFIGVTRPGYELDAEHLPTGRSLSSRSRPWRSRPPTAAAGSPRATPVWYLVPRRCRAVHLEAVALPEGPRPAQLRAPHPSWDNRRCRAVPIPGPRGKGNRDATDQAIEMARVQ